MQKIIATEKDLSTLISQLQKLHKTIALAGGCFDIVHTGHIEFITNTKKHADTILILLEHDNKVTQLKGKKRPINSQKDRATVLAAIEKVDYVFLLKDSSENSYYYNLVKIIQPDIISITENDPLKKLKQEQANSVNGKLVVAMKRNKKFATKKLAELL